MNKAIPSVKSPTRRLYAIISAIAIASSIHNIANATQIVRELFDGLNAGHDYTSLNGTTNDVTTVGLVGSWSVSPKGTMDVTNLNVLSTAIVYKDTWSLDWPLGA